ncbi:MAG: TIGR04013 family B12-binding domain/radical SAM domain-containing protein [Promethearchaeota archaeon]
MKKTIAIVLYYSKNNKYSFNALIGALEQDDIEQHVDVFFIAKKNELFQAIDDIIQRYKKIILAISFFTTQLWEINELVKSMRHQFGNRIMLIGGGPHPTGDALGTLKMGFDLVVIGEGEETLIELIRKIQENKPFFNIKGIGMLMDDNAYVFTGKRKNINLDEYAPFPVKHNKFGAIEITRGCPYACYFCQTPHLLGTRPRHRSIDIICKYVKIMKHRNLTDIRFITPNAFSYGSVDGKTLNLIKLEALLKNIKKIIQPEGRIFLGSFPSEVRPEHVNEETIAIILKYASNDNIIIGAQSGSQKLLDSCNRGHSIEDIYKAIKITVESGLIANVDFIFGLPGEEKEDIEDTIHLIKNLIKMGAKIHAHSFIPLPMTPFEKKSVKSIDSDLQKLIKSLTSEGKAFGDWKKQEENAIKISRYIQTKKFD